MSNFKRPHRSKFNEGFSFERMLTAPFRFVTGAFQSVSSSSGQNFSETPVHVQIMQFLGGLLLLPLLFLYYIGWFAIFKWASSRHATSFVLGAPAFGTLVVFSGILVWLSGINPNVKLGGYLKRSQNAEAREQWDRMVKSRSRCVASNPSMDHKYMLMQALNLRDLRGEEKELEVTGSPKQLAELKSNIFTDAQRRQALLDQLAPNEGTGFWKAHFEKAEKLYDEHRRQLQQTGEKNEEKVQMVKLHYNKMLEVVVEQAEGTSSEANARYQLFQLQAHQRLGDIYASEENWREARDNYEILVKGFDERFASLLVQAERKLAKYTHENGIDEPGNNPTHWTVEANEHFREYAAKLELKLEEDTGDFPYHRGLANLYVAEKQYGAATVRLTQALAETTESRKRRIVKQILGRVFYEWYLEEAEKNDPESFEVQFRRLVAAIANSPSTDSYYRRLWEDGWLDHPLESEQTKSIIRESLLGKNAFMVDCMLATKYLLENEERLGRQKLRIAHKQQPVDTPIAVAKITNALVFKRPETAERCEHIYEVLTEIAPNNYYLMRFQADFYLWQERYADAARYLEISLEEVAELDCLMFLAICNERLGNLEGFEYYKGIVNTFMVDVGRPVIDFDKLSRNWDITVKQRVNVLEQNQSDDSNLSTEKSDEAKD